MKKIFVLLLFGAIVLVSSGCRESYRRTTVAVVSHGHYGHHCGNHCSHFRPVIVYRSSPVIIYKSHSLGRGHGPSYRGRGRGSFPGSRGRSSSYRRHR